MSSNLPAKMYILSLSTVVAVLAMLQYEQMLSPPLLKALYIGIASTAVIITYYLQSWWIGTITSIGLFFLLSIPKATTGYYYGIDSWKYIGSAKRIKISGWTPDVSSNLAHTDQFPGTQILSVLLSYIFDLDIISISRYLPLIIVSSILLLIFAISLAFGLDRWEAAICIIALVSYSNLTADVTYHHIALGIFGIFFILYTILSWKETKSNQTRWYILFILGTILIIISHQFSSVLAGILVVVAAYIPFFDRPSIKIFDSPSRLFPAITFFIFGVLYYLWIGSQFILAFTAFIRSKGTTQQPSPLLVQELNPLFGDSLFTKIFLNPHTLSILFLSSSLGFILVWGTIQGSKFDIKKIVEQVQTQLPHVTSRQYILFYWIVSLFFITILDQVAFVGAIPRMAKVTVPLLLIGFLMSKESPNRDTMVNVLVITTIAIFISLNLFMYPGYLIGNTAPQHENTLYLRLDEDHKSAFEWAEHGDRLIGDSQARQYLIGLDRDVAVTESQEVYIRCISGTETLVLLREGHLRALNMRRQPFQYALTKQHYERFDRRTCLNRVYSNDRNRLYFHFGK